MKFKASIPLILVPLTLLIISSCSKFSESIQRDVVIPDTLGFSIPSILTTRDATKIVQFSSTLGLETTIKNNAAGFSIADLKKTKVSSIILTLPTADTLSDYSFIEKISLKITSSTDTTQAAVLGSILANPESKVKVLQFKIDTDGDLSKLLIQSNLKYTLTGKVRNTPTKLIPRAVLVFEYRATLNKE